MPIVAVLSLATQAASAEITVYAAASLTNALGDIAEHYRQAFGMRIKLSFAASSALAKQIEQGAPADLFASADTKWMDYLEGKGKIDRDTRKNLLGNSLVLVAPRGTRLDVKMQKGFDFAGAFSGKLCTGNTESVPVGAYAKEALGSLGWWDKIQYRIVGTEDVRAALTLVERGECDAGIVYATDAKQSKKADLIATFPEETHSAIVYPFALVTQSGEAKAFLRYLESEQSTRLFAAYGFKRLQ
jgi:molybdate transport system substrate-binding protein